MMIEISGFLVAEPTTGLGIQNEAGVQRVMWPNGWSARRETDGIVLLNRSGELVATEGEFVRFGSTGTQDWFLVCETGE